MFVCGECVMKCSLLVLRYERPLIRRAVMSEGTVAESGNPIELLRQEASLFKAYMDQNLQINAENAAAAAGGLH